MTWPAQHISLSIDAEPAEVIALASDPRQLPKWAAGLSTGIREDNGRWLARSPMGDIEVRFVGPTAHGILDHDVVLPDGTVVHNPLRVLRNERGSEVVFTLFHRAGMSDADYAADAAMVRADLSRLKALVETT